MTTATVFSALAALLVLALVRRPQAITLTLAVAFAASLVLVHTWPREHLLPMLVALDCAVVVVMGWLARIHASGRAEIVGAIGTLKIALTIAAVELAVPPVMRAAADNTGFAIQVIVAGGMADGILRWLGYRPWLLGYFTARNAGNLGGRP